GRVERHPCHLCPDRERHTQWAERAARLEREVTGLRKRVDASTRTLSAAFERVVQILEEYRYLEGFNLTPRGWVLARIYNENDLLVSEALLSGWLEGLDPAELAALASTFVFESRGPARVPGSIPTAAARRAYSKIVSLSEQILRREQRAGIELTRGTEAGFGEIVYRWCRVAALEEVLGETTAGDFIRSTKQTLDLLRQLREVAEDPELERALRAATESLNRGVVAYTGVI
ncbi:MAG: DEAD/DEAH box helicase, partial [Actinomycetota bacterium]